MYIDFIKLIRSIDYKVIMRDNVGTPIIVFAKGREWKVLGKEAKSL